MVHRYLLLLINVRLSTITSLLYIVMRQPCLGGTLLNIALSLMALELSSHSVSCLHRDGHLAGLCSGSHTCQRFSICLFSGKFVTDARYVCTDIGIGHY